LFDTKRRNFLFFAVCGESGAVEEVRHGGEREGNEGNEGNGWRDEYYASMYCCGLFMKLTMDN